MPPKHSRFRSTSICPGIVAVVLILSMMGMHPALAQSLSSSQYWRPAQRENQIEFEQKLNSVPTRVGLRSFHDQFGSEPHVAGTPGDARNIQRMAVTFRMMGLDVQVHEFWAYLAKPIDAAVQIVSPDELSLPISEDQLAEDRYSRDRELPIGFNAFSGNGDVTAEVIYANYGTKADFEQLKALGVDCTGKIVIARYGGNYRGFKAKFAQEAGAAGLIIYTDPDDSGYRRGLPYPEGGWANESHIQRGSIITLDQPGDPLTPGTFASEHAERLDPATLDLPRIPVQPIGYGAAREIISRMKGRAVPPQIVKEWQGGLPFAYRLEGGPELRVRLMVEQERSITKSANVIATMWGQTHPMEKIIIGCHHDAWGHGAGDPLAGLILVFEAAKSFFEASEAGYMPARTVVFAAWGAEEYGIIGSTEYCEQFADDLMEGAVAYINLDMAAMGPNFGSSAAPSLKQIIEEVTRDIAQIGDAQNRSVYEVWQGTKDRPTFGNLGGGSDHIGFYCHLGIPSCALGGGGAHGSAYHSNYDNLHWYRQVVGDDYEPALMLTRIVNTLVARLAKAPRLPLDPVRYAADTKQHLQSLEGWAKELNVAVNFASLVEKIDAYEVLASNVVAQVDRKMNEGDLDSHSLEAINLQLLQMERDWLRPAEDLATSGRPWFRNLYAASDPTSGYATWMLPGLREAIEQESPSAVEHAIGMYRAVFERFEGRMRATIQQLDFDVEIEKQP